MNNAGTMNEKVSSTAPIFIVGSQRSGTTMLRLMLNAHPDIAVPFESGFITRLYTRLDTFGDLRERKNIESLLDEISENSFVKSGNLITDRAKILQHEPKNYADLIRAIYETFAESRGKRRWGDKEPAYVTDIDVLAKIFPDLKVIHLVRDGRDVAYSLQKLSWGSNNLPRLAREWAWKVTLAKKAGSFLGDQYLEIKYENLVQNPQGSLETICKFLNEPFSQDMLNYSDSASKEMPTDSLEFHRSSVSSPDVSKIQQWKENLSRSDQMIFDEEAGETLELFGYERVPSVSSYSLKTRKLYYALVKKW